MMSQHSIISTIIEHSYHSPGVRFKSFLELGAPAGSSVSAIIKLMERVVAVDRNLNNALPRHVHFVQCTTDNFFENNTETFDAVFIDADHEVGQVEKDLINALKIVNEGGLIFLHDTDPINEAFTVPGSCNNSYLIKNFLESNKDTLIWITLPITSEGITIIQKKNSTRVDRWQR